MKYTMNLIRTLALMAAGLLPLAAQAHYIRDDCLRSEGSLSEARYINPITLNIGRDVPVGEAFGPWYTDTLTWTCTRTNDHKPNFSRPNDYFHTKSWVYPTGVVDRGVYAADPSFHVYSFGNYNVGFIAKVTRWVKNGEADTLALNTAPGITSENEQELKGSVARVIGNVSEFHVKVQVRLVKLDGTPLPLPTQKLVFPAIRVQFFSTRYHKDNNVIVWKTHSNYKYWLTTTVKKTAATCELINGNTIADRTVQLGNVYTHNLRTDGFGPSTDFDLHFRQCPPGMSAIQYEFQPLPQGTTVTNGILPQQATGPTAASGVGVQVLDENGLAVPFHQALPLATYNPNASAPANYTLPLKARIVHTGDPLNGGEVEAAMKVSVTYK